MNRPVKQSFQGRPIYRPAHQANPSVGSAVPKVHYLPPQAGSPQGAWSTSGMFLDYELPKELGYITGLQLRFEVRCDVDGGLIVPGTPHWVQQIEVSIGSQLVETLYPQDIFTETVGFQNKDELDSTNEVLLVNPTTYIGVDQRLPNTGVYGSNFFAYLPFNCCLTTARIFNHGIDDSIKLRVYFPPNLFNGAPVNLAAATLLVQEDAVAPEVAKEIRNASHREGIVYSTIVRQRQNQTITRTSGSQNTIELTGLSGSSAGVIVYAGPVVVPGPSNYSLNIRYPINTLQFQNNMGNKKEGIEELRGEYLIAFTWKDHIGTSYPAREGASTYLVPFSASFKRAVENGENTGALVFKGNDRLVLSPHTGMTSTWSLTITNYIYQAFVIQNNKLVSIIRELNK
jgi:hypothetical protein